MGALDECHYNGEIGNGVYIADCDCVELDSDDEEEEEAQSIEDAVRILLQGLGEDIHREGLRRTPLRVAKALREGTRGYTQKVKDIVNGALFLEAGLESRVGCAGGTGGLVIVRDLDLYSYCESCLLPFHVKCHIGYIPSGERVVGLSKLARVAEIFAKRLQEPHRLAREISDALHHAVKPTGVAVLLKCTHIHFPDFESAIFEPNHRGWVTVSVTSGSGAFEDEMVDSWTDFLTLLRFRGTNIDDHMNPVDKLWCPSSSSRTFDTAIDPAMLRSVSSILRKLGEDPSRKELSETPARFLKWLMSFRKTNFDVKLNAIPHRHDFILHSHGGDRQHLCSEMNLPLWSQCEHHLLPFHGVVHIGYYGSTTSRVTSVGKSILQSIVHFYGFKLQVQERLTRQIAETASTVLGEDTIVVVEANHTCMISRGIEKFGSSTATFAVLGRFATDPAAREKFLQIVPKFGS
ncbi:GTP cyclohydrolase 1-like [Andrographis paniculata]|uniref:GTP cyclohydrolase 1-like n=1 Tax=Andrographis paniculata TaxID=175694 RepID=UPI0021E6FF80|nr:GTP cyclohydrolase 1-like [Andrographis paniculata]